MSAKGSTVISSSEFCPVIFYTNLKTDAEFDRNEVKYTVNVGDTRADATCLNG